jgi:hypothetical protein
MVCALLFDWHALLFDRQALYFLTGVRSAL